MRNVKHKFGNKNALRGDLKDDKEEAVCKASEREIQSTGVWERN